MMKIGSIDFVEKGTGAVVFRTCDEERDRVVFQMGTSDAVWALNAAQIVSRHASRVLYSWTNSDVECVEEAMVKVLRAPTGSNWERMVYCRASICRFATHDGWWYEACPHCGRQLKLKENSEYLFHVIESMLLLRTQTMKLQ
ncbi:hypothetical protein ABKV19_014224 [Rosa sericea]